MAKGLRQNLSWYCQWGQPVSTCEFLASYWHERAWTLELSGHTNKLNCSIHCLGTKLSSKAYIYSWIWIFKFNYSTIFRSLHSCCQFFFLVLEHFSNLGQNGFDRRKSVKCWLLYQLRICDRCVTQIGHSNIAWQAHLVLVLVKIILLTNRSSGKARASPGKPSWLSIDYDPSPHCSTLHALLNTILLHMHSNIGRSDPAINVNTGDHRPPQRKLDVILPFCR